MDYFHLLKASTNHRAVNKFDSHKTEFLQILYLFNLIDRILHLQSANHSINVSDLCGTLFTFDRHEMTVQS